VASIHAQKNRAGNTYRVLWRRDGQRSLTFKNLLAAERFKTLLEDHGPDEAHRMIELDEFGRHVPTVTEWLTARSRADGRRGGATRSLRSTSWLFDPFAARPNNAADSAHGLM
jgi:hypothetical protein